MSVFNIQEQCIIAWCRLNILYVHTYRSTEHANLHTTGSQHFCIESPLSHQCNMAKLSSWYNFQIQSFSIIYLFVHISTFILHPKLPRKPNDLVGHSGRLLATLVVEKQRLDNEVQVLFLKHDKF